jgi:hypothetical protein
MVSVTKRLPPKDDTGNAGSAARGNIYDTLSDAIDGGHISGAQASSVIYLLHEIERAIGDQNDEAWSTIIEPAFTRGAMQTNGQDEAIAACFDFLEDWFWKTFPTVEGEIANNMLGLLPYYDRAFEALDSAYVERLARDLIKTNPGCVRSSTPQQRPHIASMLARLTLRCGALGAARVEKPSQQVVKTEANRLRQARSRTTPRVKYHPYV